MGKETVLQCSMTSANHQRGPRLSEASINLKELLHNAPEDILLDHYSVLFSSWYQSR